MIQALTVAIGKALRDEGDTTTSVTFSPHLPKTVTVPAVVIAPGDPFLVPETIGGDVLERWDVMVFYSRNMPDFGVSLFRDLSLRIRQGVASVGGQWIRTTGPRTNGEATDHLMVVNEIQFAHTGALNT